MAELDLPAVPYTAQVQRLMVAYIKEERRFRRHGLTLPPDAAILEPLDAVAWTSTNNGYTSKVFEVSEVVDDLSTCLQRVALRERDPTDYSYPVDILLPSTASPPGTVLPSTQTVPGFTVTAISLTDAASNARRPAIAITWTGDLPDVAALEFECRRTGTTVLVAKGVDTNLQDGNTIFSAGLLPSTPYQVRSRLVVNRPRAWTAWTAVTTTAAFTSANDFSGGTLPAVDLSGELDIARFAANIRPVELLSALPTTGNTKGRMVTLTTDPNSEVYRHTGSPAGAAGFTLASDGANLIVASIAAGKFAAGAIRTPDLAADQILASKVLIGDPSNMIPDNPLVDDDAWILGAGLTFLPPVATAFSRRRINYPANAVTIAATSRPVPVETGDTYYAQIHMYFGAGTASAGQAYIQWMSDVAGVYSFVSQILIGTSSGTGRTKYVGQITVPAGANAARLLVQRTGGGTAVFTFDSPLLRKAMQGKLYVDGSVQAIAVDTNSFSAAGLAIFGGGVQSDDFVTGVAGWRILKTGAAEFSQLIVRNSLGSGLVLFS